MPGVTPAAPADAPPTPSITDDGSNGDLRSRKPRTEMDAEELWTDLRHGSRNVAGVTWQVNVCVYLLIAAYAGEVDFARITPEGYEDADCERADGTRTFVQMKEKEAGDGRLAAAAVADALHHAEQSARGATVAIITDAGLGSGLGFSGWVKSLADDSSAQAVEDVISALIQRGYGELAARSILGRAHLISLPYRVRDLAESLLVRRSGCHPTVASIALSRLTELIATASADQRATTPATARRFAIHDVDSILADAQDAVDISGLDAAVTSGVCVTADFLTPAPTPARTFYLGVDGAPGHIAANLDVVRPVELAMCGEGLSSEKSVIIVGASGSGKSILLWRAARDLVPGARVVRVRRTQDRQDADLLARHVRLLRPSEASPVLVVADDLGRPPSAAWPDAARQLRELPFTLLLAAARSEDFRSDNLVGSTRIIVPRLDPATARSLADGIAQTGLQQQMHVEEAIELCDGLLMEFIALMTTGQRLEQVLTSQAAGLTAPGRELQREAARLLTAAHSLGFSLDADRLGNALSVGPDVAQVGDALGVLRDEYVVVQDGRTWRGLHELRSAALTELLHENPPPTLGATLGRVAEALDPDHLGWMLRRVSERAPELLPELSRAIEHVLTDPSTSPRQVAEILEGAERADNMRYALATLPYLQVEAGPALPIHALALWSYPVRNQGLKLDPTGSERLDAVYSRMSKLAATLPARVDFDDTLRQVCTSLTGSRLSTLLAVADPADALRVLEAGREHVPVPLEVLQNVIGRTPRAENPVAAELLARLLAVAARHVSPDQLRSAFGTVTDRAVTVASADPFTLDVTVDEHARSVHVERLVPPESSTPSGLQWDTPPNLGSDALNAETVAALRRIADACPELERFEIVTVTPSGDRYVIAGFEPGHKDMTRSALPERISVRQSVGYQAAIRRATSARTWTEVVKAQVGAAGRLVELAAQAPLRMKPSDNARRRREWNESLDEVIARIAAIGSRPQAQTNELDVAQARADDSYRSDDRTTRALSKAADAVHLLSVETPAELRTAAIAISIREAVREITTAKNSADAVLSDLGSPLPEELVDSLRCVGNLAAALSVEPSAAASLRGTAPLPSAEEVWERVRMEVRSRRTAIVARVFERIPSARIQCVVDPEPSDWSVDDAGWLVTVPLEQLDETQLALAQMSEADHEAFGSHLAVLAIARDDAPQGQKEEETDTAPPVSAAANVDPNAAREVSVGVGLRLARYEGSPTLPLTPEQIRMWEQAGGLPAYPAAADAPLVGALVESLVERSWQVARRSLRKVPDPAEAPAERTVSEIVRTLGLRGSLGGGDGGQSDLNAALGILIDQVSREERGESDTSLAASVAHGAMLQDSNPQEQYLLLALAEVHLTSMTSGDRL